MVSYAYIIGLCHSVAILWMIMSCEVAALPFQAHANYGTWSIDFDQNTETWIYQSQFEECFNKIGQAVVS